MSLRNVPCDSRVFTATLVGLCGCGRDPRTGRAAMGFYGTLKLIFYKVRIEYRSGWIDPFEYGLS